MTTSLAIKKTTSIIDANKETDNAIYEVRYQVVDIKGAKNLQVVHAEVYERNPDDGSMTNIGYMDYGGDGISIKGFPMSAKTTTYMSEFLSIVEEIKSGIA